MGRIQQKNFNANSKHFRRFSSLKIVLRDDDVMGFLEHSWTKRFGPFGQLLAICFPLFNKVQKKRTWLGTQIHVATILSYIVLRPIFLNLWALMWRRS